MNVYLALVISILLGVCGQISLKAGTIENISKSMFFNPYILLGLLCYFVSAFFYIYSIRKIPLSIAFPSVSISYVLVAFVAHIIWNEAFGFSNIVSLLLISSGIFILYHF